MFPTDPDERQNSLNVLANYGTSKDVFIWLFFKLHLLSAAFKPFVAFIFFLLLKDPLHLVFGTNRSACDAFIYSLKALLP